MPEYKFKQDSYAPEHKITLDRQAILDLYRAATQFPDVDTYDITVTKDGIRAQFTLDFTRASALSPDTPKPTQDQVLTQLSSLGQKPAKPKEEDNPNATHNQDTDRSATEAAK
jgi:hypothetical protein